MWTVAVLGFLEDYTYGASILGRVYYTRGASVFETMRTWLRGSIGICFNFVKFKSHLSDHIMLGHCRNITICLQNNIL